MNCSLSRWALLTAIARNQFHRLIGGALRGGNRVSTWTPEIQTAYSQGIYQTLASHIGNVQGKVGLEIGPGDNLSVCQLFIQNGAHMMYAIEKYAPANLRADKVELLRIEIENLNLPTKIDFAYSNDVFEHVTNVLTTMTRIFDLLLPGGRFASSVDLRGHNCFNLKSDPLRFLTCPDWLWKLLFSHIETTNRVRRSELISAALKAGFKVIDARPLVSADPAYLASIRPQLQSRYASLNDEDLSTLQLLLVLEKPSHFRDAPHA